MIHATAAVLRELTGPYTIEEIRLDEPGPGEIAVRIAGVGLCHTDLLPRSGLTAPPPFVPGHEVVPALAKALSLPVSEGIMVVEVTPGSPAQRAGIRGGDRAVQVGNRIVRARRDGPDGRRSRGAVVRLVRRMLQLHRGVAALLRDVFSAQPGRAEPEWFDQRERQRR